jgi:hypothetical protein
MSSKQYSFGKVITDIADYDKDKVVRLVGIPNVSPTFINRIDENFWFDYWNKMSDLLDIEYTHEQRRFYVNNSKIYWPKEEVDKATEDIMCLTKAYSKSAELYNHTIAEPFIKERKGLLDKILE